MPKVSGSISAVFAETAGQTRLIDKYHAYPLKIAKTFLFEHGQLGVYVMDASPGIMAGDQYSLEWRFGEHTNVFITNQSYTKVHPARTDAASAARPSEQRQKLILGCDSYVEYMPEPLMLYKDAVFYSSTEVHMAPGSALVYTDTVCPGRTQRGELFHYEIYQNLLTVTYGEELIYCSKQRTQPAKRKLSTVGGWSDYTHIGSLYVFSDRVDAIFVERLRDYVDKQRHSPSGTVVNTNSSSDTDPLYYGISRTFKYGLILSVMGNKTFEIQSLLDKAWQFTREFLFLKQPLLIRK